MSEAKLHIALVAGEHSGDTLGASLMASLKQQHKGEIAFSGLGGAAMIKEGMPASFALSEVSIVGFLDILLRLPHLLRRIREVANVIIAAKPDVLVVIDSPDFTHRVARRVKRALPALPIINYAPPQVWAWRAGRAAAMTEYIDRVIAIFPFEAAEFAALDGPETFYAGHPLAHALPSKEAGHALREREGIGTQEQVIVLAPGSRQRELMRLVPLFCASVAHGIKHHDGLKFLWLAAPEQEERLANLLEHETGFEFKITHDKEGALAAANVALAASGTINLELALADVPFICAYKVSWLEEKLVRTLSHAEDVCLANLILGRHVVPEHVFHENTQPEQIGKALSQLLETKKAQAMQQAFSELRERMEVQSKILPGARAAELVLDLV